MNTEEISFKERLKNIIIGVARNPRDKTIFQKISLIALFAWVGLGADGLSSSCYGPQEAFLALKEYPYLAIFVAIGSAITIFVICASYSQIVEIFPYGGGGYLVASKLLSPFLGMITGCALIIDYVLTIAVSLTSGIDAIFSLIPLEFHKYKLISISLILFIMMILNMRGVKESIFTLTPIFFTFLFTHIFIIVYGFFQNIPQIPLVATSIQTDINESISKIGFFGMLFLLLYAYTMGAGTYTGLEAVSNAGPILKPPKAKTAQRTMRYMAFSLSFMVLGLVFLFLLYNIKPIPGKTLNAILFERVTEPFGDNISSFIVIISLLAEASLLFVAAQAGFVAGPTILANMAHDRWLPTRFSILSDRLVTQNGILIMSILAFILIVLTKGSLHFLIILYSINVFIAFCLSQFGMVRYWLAHRASTKDWLHKLFINLIGFILTSSILLLMVIFKFNEGAWITLAITGGLVGLCFLIRRHYRRIRSILRRLNSLVKAVEAEEEAFSFDDNHLPICDPKAKTAVLIVNGFNGIGLHTLFGIMRMFPEVFKNFIFVEIGVVDAGNFKGINEIKNLENHVKHDIERYVRYIRKKGYYAEGIWKIGTDVVEEIEEIAKKLIVRFPASIFFGGQLIFPSDSLAVRLLHNYTVFTIQKRLYRQGISFVILPIRV